MEAKFWHRRWEENNIGFHVNEANPLLIQFFSQLALVKGSRVFLPLCGKTLDIGWLLSQGYRVAGIELSERAIEQLFTDLGLNPERSRHDGVNHYSDRNLDIFVGDIFDLSPELLGPVDAVYDRAALVALPPDMRRRYTSHLMRITEKAPQLVICYEYDQHLMKGPPFSIPEEEIRQHYREGYELRQLASIEVSGGVKGKCPGHENVWLLKNKQGAQVRETSWVPTRA